MMILATLYKPNINADAKHIFCVLLKFVTHNFLDLFKHISRFFRAVGVRF